MIDVTKILFLIPSLTGGGAEKVLVNLVNNLDPTQYQITVQALFDSHTNKQFLKPHINYLYSFKKQVRGNIHWMKIFPPSFLYNYLIKDDYDLAISYLQGATTRIISGCHHPKTKIINWVHNEFHDMRGISKCYRSPKEAIACHVKYDATVFVAHTAQASFCKSMPALKDNVHVIYNTIEPEIIRSLAQEKIQDNPFDQGNVNLISVGRFVPQKAFGRLIRIVGRLKNEDHFPVHLFLLGNGKLQKKYEKLAADLHIQDSVHFLGYQQNPYHFVKNADLFVCSSLHEGYSTAVTEALIVGTPVVATLCSGMVELLGENNEYGMITANDEKALYDQIKKLLSDHDELNALRERAKIRAEQFNVESKVKEVETLFCLVRAEGA